VEGRVTERISLEPISSEQRPILDRLLQLYCHDFDEYLHEGIGSDGLFDTGITVEKFFVPLWKDRWKHWAYFARLDTKLAGFSLLSDRVEYGEKGRYIEEFFLLRSYRGQGLGKELAFRTFDLYRGYWEIVAIGPNLPAQGFWRAVVEEYSLGRRREFTIEEGAMTLHFQTFDSSSW
jgi:predicted acetyltransferase